MDMIDGWNKRFSGRCQCLHPSIRRIGRDLERLRVALVMSYRQCEQTYESITLEPLEGFHDSIQELFFTISKEISEEPTLAHVLPATNSHPVSRFVETNSSSNTASNSGKRSRSNSSGEEPVTVHNVAPVASTSLIGSRKRARIEREQEHAAPPRVGMQTRSKARAQARRKR